VNTKQPIYLDYNATTPIAQEVADAMRPYLYGFFGNPSSMHPYGAQTKLAIAHARAQVADLLGCSLEEVIFTSGGTESNNYAIRGAVLANQTRGRHIITSTIEHPAVLEVCRYLETQGFQVTYLPVDRDGRVDPADLAEALTPQTILVSIMHANNEVGTIQSIAELAKLAHAQGALFHTDAAQSVGKIRVDVRELGVDLLSIAGHKLYAPKGVGALYVRSGVHLEKLMYGANHESDRRPGTENVLEVVGLGKACEIAGRDLERNMRHYQEMRDRLHQGLAESLPEKSFLLNGHAEQRLPNTLSLAFHRVEANTLLSEIGDRVAASAGAACHSDQIDLSHVLTAMQVPIDYAMGTVRFSTGRGTTAEEIDRAVEIVGKAVERLLPQTTEVLVEMAEDISEIKLTHFTQGLGCACKLRPQALEKALANLPPSIDPKALVDASTADDAAVYQLTDALAVVQTVDFFTPIVDEPYWFGAISAANSLSDIYAMGAKPLFALNIVGFPSNRLPLKVLEEILRGAQDKASEAGITILGGHTVDDIEPKYGMAVTGIVHPDRVIRNSTAQVGDVLVLTKPLGMGILATAMKRGLADEATRRKAIRIMATLNKDAAEVMETVEVHACTDITGFGLLGHLHEMATGSGVDVSLQLSAVPILQEARVLAAADIIPGGTLNNLSYVEAHVRFAEGVSRLDQILLADAQTSGGLLISLPEGSLQTLLDGLAARGVTGAVVGRVDQAGSGRIHVKK
jgi:cysteine desulfurase NifS/selenium donor protein